MKGRNMRFQSHSFGPNCMNAYAVTHTRYKSQSDGGGPTPSLDSRPHAQRVDAYDTYGNRSRDGRLYASRLITRTKSAQQQQQQHYPYYRRYIKAAAARVTKSLFSHAHTSSWPRRLRSTTTIWQPARGTNVRELDTRIIAEFQLPRHAAIVTIVPSSCDELVKYTEINHFAIDYYPDCIHFKVVQLHDYLIIFVPTTFLGHPQHLRPLQDTIINKTHSFTLFSSPSDYITPLFVRIAAKGSFNVHQTFRPTTIAIFRRQIQKFYFFLIGLVSMELFQ
ncbi:unnamed protein product, partial [Trichogramma brassicae]